MSTSRANNRVDNPKGNTSAEEPNKHVDTPAEEVDPRRILNVVGNYSEPFPDLPTGGSYQWTLLDEPLPPSKLPSGLPSKIPLQLAPVNSPITSLEYLLPAQRTRGWLKNMVTDVMHNHQDVATHFEASRERTNDVHARTGLMAAEVSETREHMEELVGTVVALGGTGFVEGMEVNVQRKLDKLLYPKRYAEENEYASDPSSDVPEEEEDAGGW